MFGRRRQPDAAAPAPSPWSSEANAPDAPPLSWESPRAEFEPLDDEDASSAPGSGISRSWLVIGAVGAVAVAGLVWWWPTATRDDAVPGDAVPSDEATATTLGTLPPPTSEATQPDEEVDERDEPAGDEPGPVEGDSGDADGEADASTGGEPLRPSAPSVRTIDLPAGLPDFEQPFEVVMATEGGVSTLSLPSGTLRTVPVPALSGFEEPWAFAVAADTSMLLTSSGVTFVDRSGAVEETDLDGMDGGATVLGSGVVDGATRFVLARWSPEGTADIVVLEPGGEVASAGVLPSFPAYTTTGGSIIVGDAGGVYRLDTEGGGTRVADGALLGHGSGRILVRECDSDYRCALATIDLTSGERIDFDEVDDAAVPGQLLWNDGAVVSPDGTRLVATVRDPLGGDATDLLLSDDGSSRIIRHDGAVWGWPSQVSWAPDSSGYFRSSPPFGPPSSGAALRFTTIEGESIEFPEVGENGVVWIGVRAVDEELPADAGELSIEPIPDAGVDIVGIDGGAAVHLDLATGASTTWAVPDAGPLPDAFFVDGNVVVVAEGGELAYRTAIGSLLDERRIEDGPIEGPRFGGTDDRLIWQPAATGDTYELVPAPFHDIGGREPWKTTSAGRGQVYGTDGEGGLVFDDDGDIVVVDPAERQLLATGRLVAIGTGGALVHACDENDTCGNVRIDADGVASAALAGPPGAAEPVEPGDAVEGTVSPDGDVMFVRLGAEMTDGGSDFAGSPAAFIDWTVTSTVPAPEPDDGTKVWWTDDSRVAFFLAAGWLHVYDRDDASVRRLTAGIFDQIVLVPTDD